MNASPRFPLTVWWSGFDAEGRRGLVLRSITRIGGVEEKSFHPQQKTALVKTSLPLVLSYFFMSAAKLGDAPLP